MRSLAGSIEHTLLKPTTTHADIERLCQDAVEHGFFGVCVPPIHVRCARDFLQESMVKVVTVVGFPLGNNANRIKVHEAMEAALSGAEELDMVMLLGAAQEGNWVQVREDIEAVVLAVPDVVHKVILETCYFTDEQKCTAARVAVDAGAGFVKTSTGFGPGGATVQDVRLLKTAVGENAGIKAAGGIRTKEQALAMIEAGATRIGTSSGVALVCG